MQSYWSKLVLFKTEVTDYLHWFSDFVEAIEKYVFWTDIENTMRFYVGFYVYSSIFSPNKELFFQMISILYRDWLRSGPIKGP